MTKQKVKDWKELIRDMQKVDAMRCKPDFTRLSNNFITDEDKLCGMFIKKSNRNSRN